MAEFKLGRIRFIWKGDWSPLNTYFKDDVVRNGGNTYICIQGHNASSLFTENQDLYWDKISDGVEWKNVWTPETYYKVNDIVKYGGLLYISNTAHTSSNNNELGLEADQENWDQFSEGFDYKQDWDVDRRYKENDIVKYGGTVYVCVIEHTSAVNIFDGLEADLNTDSTASKWEVFSEGFSWNSTWTTNYRYKKNDVVRYGGQLYVCNQGHVSSSTDQLGLELDQTKWDYLNRGIEYKGDWSTGARYKINDVVKYGGGLWLCVEYHSSQTYFTDDEEKWEQFVEGLEFEDSWDQAIRYQPGDFVTYGGYSYVANTNNMGSRPSQNPADWDLFTTGFRFVGEWSDDYTTLEYKVGDVVTKNGYTYLCVDDHAELQEPPNELYWKRLNSGIKWRNDVGANDGSWTAGVDYKLGDAVSFTSGNATNLYLCIQEHTSQTDPLVDGGTYWNIVSGGNESEILTTPGDIVYYHGSGPTRLPIGRPGQVLAVNNSGNAPEWKDFGSINHIFYVETYSGIDRPSPEYGSVIDRPWKTIKYATQQVDNGALRLFSKTLLQFNTAFIQNETLAWVEAQILDGSGIWAGFVNNQNYLTLEEFNKVINSLIYDISHNGNVETRGLVLSFFSDNTLTTEMSNEVEQFVAAINHMKTVIDAVLSNLEIGTDVGTKYSAFSQTIDESLTEESDSQTIINNLVELITTSINNNSRELVPSEYRPNNSIFVKTGEFSEVLPINVPQNTAIIGDELRSTRIFPAGSITEQSDVSYSLDAVLRIKSVVDAIVSGNTVTKSPSNTESQISTGLVIGTTASSTAAAELFQTIYDYINSEINNVGTTPSIVGSNTANHSTDYTYAVEALQKNKNFIIQEAIAYIKDTYPAYAINEEIVRSQFEQYVHGVTYDLTYTGNYKSLLAAKFYTSSVKGSKLSDMFYMRNGTGLRNCTVRGLDGRTDGNIAVTPEISGLTSVNGNGTRRPLAGAFVSLDPGWGIQDQTVWITNKSPYVQNVSTFGNACVGCKIDGSLHAGGNDSIVSNDFTQICSDGIGVWCTNLGRTELVSVFSYYAHIGYLAESGGKIRATNGNSSYGTFGTVAEGVDESEVPVTANVNNQANDAIVGRVLTNGDQVLTLEYANAGVEYTTDTTAVKTVTNISASNDARIVGTYYDVSGTSSGVGTGQLFNITITDLGLAIVDVVKGGSGHTVGDVITVLDSQLGSGGAEDLTFEVETIGDATEFIITGEGFNAAVSNANVNNGGIYEVRMQNIDVTGNNEGDFGGSDYTVAENVSQGGSNTSIILSNTDTVVNSAQYEGTQSRDGVAIYIYAGTGAGQYGYIHAYNPATKLASVKKYSDDSDGWDHVIPGTAIESVLDESTNYIIEPSLVFTDPSGNSPGDVGYNYENSAKARPLIEDGKIIRILLWDPGTGYTTLEGDANFPTLTINDPNNTIEAPFTIRVGSSGVLTQPSWENRGTQFTTASAEISGDGYADSYQPGTNIRVSELSQIPKAGSNIVFSSLPDQYFKLVAVRRLEGLGPYVASLQVSPEIDISDAPDHNTSIEMRIRYSQVRLTGHDYLDIGTGNFADTNYPNVPLNDPNSENEISEGDGGRVFYTSTDQDGNFRVGRLFNVEQSTGVATLNADAFNISGLQELQLGAVELGGSGAVVTEFSTDGTFTANSDNIVPTQKAIKTYIQSQIGGGSGELNVNSITAGSVFISGQEITTTNGKQLNIKQKVNYTGGVSGSPVALNYFLQA